MTKNLQLKTARVPVIRVHLEDDEMVVDSFAGGGGASSGVEWAIRRSPDIAINHDAEAIAMHAANHPTTKHYTESVWEVDPVKACAGRRVGLAWFSPTCTHFSKAKGTALGPAAIKLRGLAWSAVRWASTVRPRVIALENVSEFQDWGPLGKDGEADKSRKGQTFRAFVRKLERLGYAVQHRLLKACDFGAPTSRLRLFMIARCDGHPIVWPAPTHGPGRAKPFRTAAECIDWSVPVPSIFDRVKPHAPKTLARIARGVRKFVIGADRPFVVPVGEGAMVVPYMVHRSNGERPTITDANGTVHPGQAPRIYDINNPLGTIMAQGQKHALVCAMLIKHNGGNNDRHGSSGQSLNKPVGTVTSRDTKSLAAVSLGRLSDIDARRRAAAVYSFLIRYNGKGEPEELTKPLGTLTTKPRYGLVTVTVDGEEYVIVDIGLRMLTARELFRAQGFRDDYDITAETTRNGTPLTKTAQIRMCGNSVAPPAAAAIIRAQFGHAEAHVEPPVIALPAPKQQLLLLPAPATPQIKPFSVGDRVSFLDDKGKRRNGRILRVSKKTVTIDAAGWEWGIEPQFVDRIVPAQRRAA